MRVWLLHGGVLAGLLALNWLLPAWPQGMLARVMVLATYAAGYNLLFGYAGLLSLGHALFFAAGMYGYGLSATLWGWTLAPAFGAGVAAGAMLGLVAGALALRTRGVGFMIVTLMFAQAGWLAILWWGDVTRGDEGFTVPDTARRLAGMALSDPGLRYLAAWALFAAGTGAVLALTQTATGRVLIAIRENEERARLLGYDVERHKLAAVVMSATLSAAAGAGYAALFGSVGASFATVQYSILPLLWVLLGGAGTVLGPFIGTLFLYLLIDWASDLTPAYMAVAGVVLVVLTLFAPQGIAGTIRDRWVRWLP